MENQTNKGRNIAESGIFKKFMNQAQDYMKKPLRVKELLHDAYTKASEKKDVGAIAQEVWDSLQTLTRMIKAAVTGEYTGIPTSTIVGGIAVLIYFLTPIDFVPDFIPVIGLLDDVALLAWFMTSIKHELDKFAEWEKGNQATQAAEPGGVGLAATPITTNKADNEATAKPTTSGASDPAATTPKYEAYENRDPNMPPTQPGTTPTRQVPLSKPDEKPVIKDFTAHDLDTSQTPNDSAIRAASSGSGEPNVRAATTDSTRIPSSNSSDARTGGNVR
ncbi:YkvA family protein [Adhaeribacter aquaticus]|uniref:YkvA family protein n=1 Tax=Adhaeribacter aquaticus TaxID=299567 RepID=UPI00040C6A83|nr:YkvA family protein [Adhaeribacter aquaticus]